MAIFPPDLVSINRKAKGQAGRLRGNDLKRGQSGRSAVAAAAYAAGVRLKDERQGRVHDFRAKGGVYYSCIVGGGGWTGSTDRAKLWNMAEAAEVKSNATTAREWMIPLPHELTNEQRVELLRTICEDLAAQFGVIVDGSLHMPDKDGDQRNFHAHVLMTTRRVNADGTLGAKTRELDVKPASSRAVTESRRMMAQRFNEALEKAGRPERVSHESWEAQGIAKVPQLHEGVKATNARRKNARLEAEQRGEKTRHQLNMEAGAIAAFTDAERLRKIRDQLAANDRELADLAARKLVLPRKARAIKFPAHKGRKPPSEEQFLFRVMLMLADALGRMFSMAQIGYMAADAVEKTAQDVQRVAAVRQQQRALRRQESRLIAKIMRDGEGEGAAEGKGGTFRKRRRRIYDLPDALKAEKARENAQRRRPQQKPPHVYAAGSVRKRPQKARFDQMRAAKPPDRPPTKPRS